ncbi:hypothetical protein BH24ACT2_BH24ACT2_16240 [soil metagenome]|jgi:hypothetical protein
MCTNVGTFREMWFDRATSYANDRARRTLRRRPAGLHGVTLELDTKHLDHGIGRGELASRSRSFIFRVLDTVIAAVPTAPATSPMVTFFLLPTPSATMSRSCDDHSTGGLDPRTSGGDVSDL